MNDSDKQYFWEAALYGRLDLVQYLVEKHGFNPRTPGVVQAASENGHEAVVRYVVARGADIRAHDNLCVREAAASGHLSVIKFLVSIGADIRACESRSLWQAAAEGHLGVVQFLVACGANIDDRDNIGPTPEIRIYGIAHFLFSRGSSIDIGANDCADLNARACTRAARRVYFAWVPRCFDLARRSGRRARARNFRAFRRLCVTYA